MFLNDVSPHKQKILQHKMDRLEIREDDLQETFVTAQGKGGQNVNKVATCVCLVHLPTATQVKCQEYRSQALNRYHARWLLVKKIETQKRAEELKQVSALEKLRRQNRPRPANLKEEILKKKHLQSDKKKSRAKIALNKIEEE